MKQIVNGFNYSRAKNIFFVGFVLFFVFGTVKKSFSQTCDEKSYFQKYWQYMDRFHRTFIVQDRDSSGCINDGIGFSPASNMAPQKEIRF